MRKLGLARIRKVWSLLACIVLSVVLSSAS